MDRTAWKEIAHTGREFQQQLDQVSVLAAQRSISELALEVLEELGLVEHQGAELIEKRTPVTDAAIEELRVAGLVEGERALRVTPLGRRVLEAEKA